MNSLGRLYVGIDPGLSGGLVGIDEALDVVIARPLPTYKLGGRSHLDLPELSALVAALPGRALVVLEKSQVHPRDGKRSAFSTGYGSGALEAMLVAHGVRYERPAPQTWQKVVLADVPGGEDTKARAVLACRRLLPGLDLTPGRRTKAHTGLGDAGCLALYGHRVHGGGR